MENITPVLFLLLMGYSLAKTGDPPRYDTAYACEGKVLKIECREGETIHLIRANYGRFSITICNDHGNTEWSVACMSPKSLRVLHAKCASQRNCSIQASTATFGDPCPGTLKYLEAHYRCSPGNASTTTTTGRPSPPWPTSQPSVWSTTKLATLRPPSQTYRGSTSGSVPATNITTNISSNSSSSSSGLVLTTKTSAPPTSSRYPPPSSVDELLPPATAASPLPARDDERTESSSPTFPISSSFVPTTKSPFTGTSLMPSSWAPEGELRQFCAPLYIRELTWNWTKAGEVTIQPCPDGANGVARWRCIPAHGSSPNASWLGSSPDLSECRSVWLTSLDARIDDRDKIVIIANDLAQVTNSNHLYGGDMMTTTSIVKKMTDRMSKDIQTFPDPNQREAIATELLQAVVRTTSNLIDDAQMPGWQDLSHAEQMRVATSLLIGLEENAFLLADTVIREKTVVQTGKNILLSVRVIRTQSLESESFPAPEEREKADIGDQLLVPRDAMADNSEGGLVRIVFVSFQRLEDILVPGDSEVESEDGNTTIRVVNSRIISASLGKGRHIQFNQWVLITLKHLRTENVSNPSCVFWDYTTSGWSEEGCEVDSTNRTHTVCRCNHLTNFAVLMDIRAGSFAVINELAVQIINVGSIFAFICLAISVIFIIPRFRRRHADGNIGEKYLRARNHLHLNLCICLGIGEILFVLGVLRVYQPALCSVAAAFLHFFFLCAFSWMTCEGFQLFLMYRNSETAWLKSYYAIAYGFPMIFLLVHVIFGPSDGTDCWLLTNNNVLGVIESSIFGSVIIVNLVFLGTAIHKYCHPSTSLKDKDHSYLGSPWLLEAAFVGVLLPITWFIAILHFVMGITVLAYVFAALNCIVSLLILFFQCLHSDQVRQRYPTCSSWFTDCSRCTDEEDRDPRTVTMPRQPPAGSPPTRTLRGRSEQRPDVASHADLAVNGHNAYSQQKMYFNTGGRGDAELDNVAATVYPDHMLYQGMGVADHRSATMGDIRRQKYRRGSERVVVSTREGQNERGPRAATLQVSKRRKDRCQSDMRRMEGDEPVYEVIGTSDMSDEEQRRGIASRQSGRSDGDHHPLITPPFLPPHPPSHPIHPAYPKSNTQLNRFPK